MHADLADSGACGRKLMVARTMRGVFYYGDEVNLGWRPALRVLMAEHPNETVYLVWDNVNTRRGSEVEGVLREADGRLREADHVHSFCVLVRAGWGAVPA